MRENSIAKEFQNKFASVSENEVQNFVADTVLKDPVKKLMLSAQKNEKGSGITLTTNEIKNFIIVIKFLQNTGNLRKGTTVKSINQEGGLLNFLGPLNESWFTITEKCTYAIS